MMIEYLVLKFVFNFSCLPFGMPEPYVKPAGLDGVTNSKSGSLRRHLSMSTALKKATDLKYQFDANNTTIQLQLSHNTKKTEV